MSQRIIDRSYVGEILQRIYSSRLNIRITISAERGYFYVEYNQNKNALSGATIEEAVTQLASMIANEFPKSSFASWWKNNMKEDSLV